METLTIDLPAMYGDHHVLEVRRILLEIPGVQEVYASSAFKVIEVTFDPSQIQADDITAPLDEVGYLGDLLTPAEAGIPVNEVNGDHIFYRHSAAYEGIGQVVSFGQDVAYRGRPLWPCPGMGSLTIRMDEGE
nr:heavy-metal-associated domain-containing protein [Anaerolineae bacterium]